MRSTVLYMSSMKVICFSFLIQLVLTSSSLLDDDDEDRIFPFMCLFRNFVLEVVEEGAFLLLFPRDNGRG